jgi:hypothetical protein
MEMSTQKKLKVAKMATQPIVAAIASENNTDKENGEDVKNEQTEQEDTGAEQQLPCGEATGTGATTPSSVRQDSEPSGGGEPAAGNDSGMVKLSEIEALVAEAEERGYLRGRNESIERLMRRPGILEQEPWQREAYIQPETEPMILNNPRVSIWDR